MDIRHFRLSTDVIPYLIIGVASLVLVGALLYQARGRKRYDDKTQTPLGMSAEEHKLRTRLGCWSMALTWTAWVAIRIFSHSEFRWGKIALYAAQAFIVLGPIAIGLAFRRKLAPYERETPNEDLLRRLQALNVDGDRRIEAVYIDERLAGRSYVTVVRRKTSIVISRKAADTLSVNELDFLMVRAATAQGDSISLGAVAFVVLIIASVIGYVLLLAEMNGGAGPDALWIWFAYPMLVAAGGLWALVHFGNNRITGDDARALRLTRDYAAAIGALQKLEVPENDISLQLTSRQLTRGRTNSMRHVAYDMGLRVPELDAVASAPTRMQI